LFNPSGSEAQTAFGVTAPNGFPFLNKLASPMSGVSDACVTGQGIKETNTAGHVLYYWGPDGVTGDSKKRNNPNFYTYALPSTAAGSQ